LTIKLTRHTVASLELSAISRQLSACFSQLRSASLDNNVITSITLSFRAEHDSSKARIMRSRGTCCSLARETNPKLSKTTTRRENFMSLKLPAHRALDALTSRAPAGVSLSRHS